MPQRLFLLIFGVKSDFLNIDIHDVLINFLLLSFISRPSRKFKVSHWPNRKITSANLRFRDRLGQSMCHLSCRRLLREHADVGRKKKGVPARSGWLPVLRNSKSWMRSLERLKGRYPGTRMARKRERAKKFHFPQTGSTAKSTTRTGSTAQKVKTENPATFVHLGLMVFLKYVIAGHERKFSS